VSLSHRRAATNSPPGEAGRDPPVRGAGGPYRSDRLLALRQVQLEKRGDGRSTISRHACSAWAGGVACLR